MLDESHNNMIAKFDELTETIRQARYYAITGKYEKAKDTLEKTSILDENEEDSISRLINLISDLQLEEAVDFNSKFVENNKK